MKKVLAILALTASATLLYADCTEGRCGEPPCGYSRCPVKECPAPCQWTTGRQGGYQAPTSCPQQKCGAQAPAAVPAPAPAPAAPDAAPAAH